MSVTIDDLAAAPEEPDRAATAHLERFAISDASYRWTARAFNIVRRMLSVQLTLHHDAGQLEAGHIFLFNHFARFETFIPQYFLYEQLGAHSRAVASSEFFGEDDALARYLRSVGAVPNDLPGLLPFLAAEILRGRKVVVFPEGGMVKDRRVQDTAGTLSVYSRTAGERRKHHSGPAVLALVLDTFKAEVRRSRRAGNLQRIESWAQGLGLASAEALLSAAEQPTRIVPCNITFYPIRVDDNLLRRGAELFARGLSRRATEELLVEGNILLRDTDMDIRLGDMLDAAEYWGADDRRLMGRIARRFDTLDDFFHASRGSHGWHSRVLRSRVREHVYAIRDEYMRRMYQSVTVNLSHLASSLVLEYLDRGVQHVPSQVFRATLYDLVKRVQSELGLHLHADLGHPDGYAGLIDGRCERFEQFIHAKTAMQLVSEADGELNFLQRLREEHDFDDIRLNNLILVYANEVAPLSAMAIHVEVAVDDTPRKTPAELAMQRFDDELRRFDLDRARYAQPEHAAINALETATRSGAPYVLRVASDVDRGRQARRAVPRAPLGVVLVHGFLASPAELRELGEALNDRGHPVVGVRLRGHGTSPWDLHERGFESWLESVAHGERIISGLAERHVIVGFSTGGSLALIRAGERTAPDTLQGLAGVVAVNVPVGFHDPRMYLVGLVHGANSVIGRLTGGEGVMPFRPNTSENPEVNYASIPIRALAELYRSVGRVRAAAPTAAVPVRLIQGDADPVVLPSAARELHALMPATLCEFVSVPSDRHGIVYGKVGDTWTRIIEFIDALA